MIISYFVRCLWKQYLRKIRGKKNRVRSLLILTSVNMADTIIESIRSNNYQGFRVGGITLVGADQTGTVIDGIPVVATCDTVVKYVCHEWVDEVFIGLPEGQSMPDDFINDFIDISRAL